MQISAKSVLVYVGLSEFIWSQGRVGLF